MLPHEQVESGGASLRHWPHIWSPNRDKTACTASACLPCQTHIVFNEIIMWPRHLIFYLICFFERKRVCLHSSHPALLLSSSVGLLPAFGSFPCPPPHSAAARSHPVHRVQGRWSCSARARCTPGTHASASESARGNISGTSCARARSRHECGSRSNCRFRAM